MSPTASPDRVAQARIDRLRAAFIDACLLELHALKPGNIHVHAAGHGMSVADFERSAEAASGPICRAGAAVGARIRDAVAATHAAVGCNTNLGIVLLAAPMVAAAERPRSGDLRQAIAAILAELTVADAVAAYEAIRLANPAGLGRSDEADVAAAPTVTLLDAMRLAAERDRIARQYASQYGDIFAIGLPTLADAARRGLAQEWAASLTHMSFLAAFPDSHIARKHGLAAAEAVRTEAAALASRLSGCDDPSRLSPPLLAFDTALKAHGLNPGTSADLTVATLLAQSLGPIVSG